MTIQQMDNVLSVVDDPQAACDRDAGTELLGNS